MKEMIRNIMKICGINTNTPPTPPMIPSMISACVKLEAPTFVSRLSAPPVSGPVMKPSSRSESGLPSQSNVSWKVRNMKAINIGIPRTGWVTIRSMRSVIVWGFFWEASTASLQIA
ncbi:hypothetical protein D3C81_1375720 [compost metagenome]